MREREYKQQMIDKALVDMTIAVSTLVGLGTPKDFLGEMFENILGSVTGPKDNKKEQSK